MIPVWLACDTPSTLEPFLRKTLFVCSFKQIKHGEQERLTRNSIISVKKRVKLSLKALLSKKSQDESIWKLYFKSDHNLRCFDTFWRNFYMMGRTLCLVGSKVIQPPFFGWQQIFLRPNQCFDFWDSFPWINVVAFLCRAAICIKNTFCISFLVAIFFTLLARRLNILYVKLFVNIYFVRYIERGVCVLIYTMLMYDVKLFELNKEAFKSGKLHLNKHHSKLCTFVVWCSWKNQIVFKRWTFQTTKKP